MQAHEPATTKAIPSKHGGEPHIGTLVFLVTVLAAYSHLLFTQRGTPTQAMILIGLGVLYAIFGTVGVFPFVNASPRQWLRLLYLLVQLGLGVAIGTLGDQITSGNIWIALLPTISHSFVLLSKMRAWLFTVLVFVCFALRILIPGGFDALLGNAPSLLGLGVSMLFVAAFSQIAIEQSRAREEIERLAADLRQANSLLANYAGQIEELATTRERNRLAREVHDSLGHYLTVANVQLEAAQIMVHSEPDAARDAIIKAQTFTRDGLSEVRRSVAALRAGPLETRTLVEALTKVVEEARSTGLQVRFHPAAVLPALSPQCEMLLYRAAQEGLTNIRKHSSATQAELTLRHDGDSQQVELSLLDNGQPTLAESNSNDGSGLYGLRERARLVGGKLEIHTREQGGFGLTVWVPTQA
jgi:signal transduction histidine kinase